MGCLLFVDGHQSFPQSEGRNFLADKRFSGFVASEGFVGRGSVAVY